MTAALSLERKGPEATGIAPDPVARNPREKDQNMTTNTTLASVRASDSDVAAAMRGLESDICDLANMALILGDILEHDLRSFENGKWRAMPEPGGTITVIFGHQQLEMIAFAYNNVIERSLALKRRWNAAADGESSK